MSEAEDSGEESLSQERERAIRAMEENVGRRKLGVRWHTALLALALTVLMFAWFRLDRDLGYFFSPKQPLTLGAEGSYRFELLRSNRYAQIHGIPTTVGTYSRDGGQLKVTVGLQGTPVLVHRNPLQNEDWPEGRPPSAVDQRPFGVRGRLLAQQDAPRYQEAFGRLGDLPTVSKEAGQLWILLEGERPRNDPGTLAFVGLLFAFALLNAWFFARDLGSRRKLR